MKVDRELVLHVARLAHIELTEIEIERFTVQLGQILTFVGKLQELQEPAEPFSFPHLSELPSRADEPRPSLTSGEAMKNAPDRKNNFFRVPRIIP